MPDTSVDLSNNQLRVRFENGDEQIVTLDRDDPNYIESPVVGAMSVDDEDEDEDEEDLDEEEEEEE